MRLTVCSLDGYIMGCALCSSVLVSRTVGWAMQLPVCSGLFLWWSRLKALFSNVQSYEYVSLTEPSRYLAPSLGRLWLKPTYSLGSLVEQGHWLCSGWLALSTGFSAWVLLGYTASRCSGQVFRSGRAESYT